MSLDLFVTLKYQSSTNTIRWYWIFCAWPTLWRQ